MFDKSANRHRNRGITRRFRLYRLTTAPHQTQNGVGGTGAQRLVRLLLDEVTARNLVEQLDNNREADRGVQVAFRNMEAETFSDQTQANHQQEA
ncbi:hypothetical protein D3C80_1430270 [compost metagenome]